MKVTKQDMLEAMDKAIDKFEFANPHRDVLLFMIGYFRLEEIE
jgi:hypothetical protein